MPEAGSALPYWVNVISALSPIAILISAILAGWWARKNILSNREVSSNVARKRATLDVIIKLESDDYYQKTSATFRDVRDGRGLMSLINPQSNRDKEERLDVQSFINHYEIMCCGIKENALDEAFLYKWSRGTFIAHWHDSREFIYSIREQVNNDQVFKQFEEFATAWDEDRFVTRTDCPKKMRNNETKPLRQN